MPSEAPPKHPMPSEARRFAVPAAFRHSRNSPSFPRRRESGPFGFGFSDRFPPRLGLDSRFRGNDGSGGLVELVSVGLVGAVG